MRGVSQGLIEFANTYRPRPGPGIEVVETSRYVVQRMPHFPIPGPNSVSWVRCGGDEVDAVVSEAREFFAARRQAFMWTLDPGTEPPGFPEALAAHDVLPAPRDPRVEVMVLPATAHIDFPRVDGLEIRDALADAESFRAADGVAAEAFGDAKTPTDPAAMAALEQRRRDSVAAGNRRHLLALIDGEPAGSSGLSLYPPGGAIVNGGAVLEKFRGRGVYRAMVAERLRLARDAGAEGLVVWGGRHSAPILKRLGFEVVGWRTFYLDTSPTDR